MVDHRESVPDNKAAVTKGCAESVEAGFHELKTRAGCVWSITFWGAAGGAAMRPRGGWARQRELRVLPYWDRRKGMLKNLVGSLKDTTDGAGKKKFPAARGKRKIAFASSKGGELRGENP